MANTARSSVFAALVERADCVLYPFPTQGNRVCHLRRVLCAGEEEEGGCRRVEENVACHARGTRVLCTREVAERMESFIREKTRYGTPAERRLYNGMGVRRLVDRLLEKRPLTFMTPTDKYMLKSGLRGSSSLSDRLFEKIGTDEEKYPFVLSELQSYDEMRLSALLAVSVPTYFINDGDRFNRAEPRKRGTYIAQGVYVGQVGARFERPGVMEYRDMVVSREQNTTENGFGANGEDPSMLAWARFWGLAHFPTFEEVANDSRSEESKLRVSNDVYLHLDVYRRRIALGAKLFFLEANQRATEKSKQSGHRVHAFCHVVGLGLGVWGIHEAQNEIFIDEYCKTARSLELPNVGDVYFAHVRKSSDTESRVIQSEGKDRIKIHFGERNPAELMPGQYHFVDWTDDEEGFDVEPALPRRLLVAQYAWDSNAFPGNEYWVGSLSGSGDPAAVCCSTLAELQNPDINRNVSGSHLHILD